MSGTVWYYPPMDDDNGRSQAKRRGPRKGASDPERLADLSPFVHRVDLPWASPAIATDADPDLEMDGTIRKQLDRRRWLQGARGIHLNPADLRHPDPNRLMWRRFIYGDLKGMAVYAGFSREPEVVGLLILSQDGKSPITARRLAKVSIEGMRVRWRRTLAEANAGLARLTNLDEERRPGAQALLARAAELGSGRRPGRGGHPDAYYADIAVRYARFVLSSRRPVRELAASLGISDESARNLVYATRKKGFLTQASAGRAGGTATARAVKALEQKGAL